MALVGTLVSNTRHTLVSTIQDLSLREFEIVYNLYFQIMQPLSTKFTDLVKRGYIFFSFIY